MFSSLEECVRSSCTSWAEWHKRTSQGAQNQKWARRERTKPCCDPLWKSNVRNVASQKVSEFKLLPPAAPLQIHCLTCHPSNSNDSNETLSLSLQLCAVRVWASSFSTLVFQLNMSFSHNFHFFLKMACVFQPPANKKNREDNYLIALVLCCLKKSVSDPPSGRVWRRSNESKKYHSGNHLKYRLA